MTHTFLVKATVCYESDEHETIEYGIVHAENYASAAAILEKEFRHDLTDLALVMTEDYDFTYIDRTTYNRIYYGDFDLNEDFLNQNKEEPAANDVPESQA